MIPKDYWAPTPPPAPAPPPEAALRWRARSKRKALVVAAIVVAAVVVVAGLAAVTVSERTGCVLGGRIGLYNVTAPVDIVNIPDNGSASVFTMAENWTVSSGSLTLGALPSREPNAGSGAGVMEGNGLLAGSRQPIFAVYSVQNSTTFSPTAQPCGQPFVAQAVEPGYCGGGFAFGFELPDPTNDSVEPHIMNESCPIIPADAGITPGAYMWFDTAYPSSNATGSRFTTVNLCGWTTQYTQDVRGSVGFPFILYVPSNGRTISVHGFVEWESWLTNLMTASYGLAPGWVWRVASIGVYSEDISGLLPPGLLAFERNAC